MTLYTILHIISVKSGHNPYINYTDEELLETCYKQKEKLITLRDKYYLEGRIKWVNEYQDLIDEVDQLIDTIKTRIESFR